MAATTGSRNTDKIGEGPIQGPVAFPVRAATKINQGSLVVLDPTDNCNARPGYTATGLIVVGRSDKEADNTSGAAGAIKVEIDQGTFPWGNSAAGDLIALDDIGKPCYIVDDQTVALTDGGGTRSLAGIIVNVDTVKNLVHVESRIGVRP
jgi:hypothetical protein